MKPIPHLTFLIYYRHMTTISVSPNLPLSFIPSACAKFKFIEKHKISIDLKTKVYKELLKWSRENLVSKSNSEVNYSSNEVVNSKYLNSHNL
jgi:hypothetical protein